MKRRKYLRGILARMLMISILITTFPKFELYNVNAAEYVHTDDHTDECHVGTLTQVYVGYDSSATYTTSYTSCSNCGKPVSYDNGICQCTKCGTMRGWSSGWNCSCGTYNTGSNWGGCSCSGYVYKYMLNGVENNTTICDQLVTGITLKNSTQTLVRGDSCNCNAEATYLDGHTATIIGTCDYNQDNLTSYGEFKNYTITFNCKYGSSAKSYANSTTMPVRIKTLGLIGIKADKDQQALCRGNIPDTSFKAMWVGSTEYTTPYTSGASSHTFDTNTAPVGVNNFDISYTLDTTQTSTIKARIIPNYTSLNVTNNTVNIDENDQYNLSVEALYEDGTKNNFNIVSTSPTYTEDITYTFPALDVFSEYTQNYNVRVYVEDKNTGQVINTPTLDKYGSYIIHVDYKRTSGATEYIETGTADLNVYRVCSNPNHPHFQADTCPLCDNITAKETTINNLLSEVDDSYSEIDVRVASYSALKANYENTSDVLERHLSEYSTYLDNTSVTVASMGAIVPNIDVHTYVSDELVIVNILDTNDKINQEVDKIINKLNEYKSLNEQLNLAYDNEINKLDEIKNRINIIKITNVTISIFDGVTPYTKIYNKEGIFPSVTIEGLPEFDENYNIEYKVEYFVDGNYELVPEEGLIEAGTYQIRVTTLDSDYPTVVNTGTLVIEPKLLTYNVTVVDKQYDNTNEANVLWGSLIGILSNDNVYYTPSTDMILTYSSVDVSNNIPINVSGSAVLYGNSNKNYKIEKPNVTGNITKAKINAVISSATKVFGRKAPTFTVSYKFNDVAVSESKLLDYNVVIPNLVISSGTSNYSYDFYKPSKVGNYTVKLDVLSNYSNYEWTIDNGSYTITAPDKTYYRLLNTSAPINLGEVVKIVVNNETTYYVECTELGKLDCYLPAGQNHIDIKSITDTSLDSLDMFVKKDSPSIEYKEGLPTSTVYDGEYKDLSNAFNVKSILAYEGYKDINYTVEYKLKSEPDTEYKIIPQGIKNANIYSIRIKSNDTNYEDSVYIMDYTINKREVKFTVAAQTKLWDSTTNCNLVYGNVTNIVNSDIVGITNPQGVFNLSNVGIRDVILNQPVALTGSVDVINNYFVTQPSIKGTIEKASIELAMQSIMKPWGMPCEVPTYKWLFNLVEKTEEELLNIGVVLPSIIWDSHIGEALSVANNAGITISASSNYYPYLVGNYTDSLLQFTTSANYNFSVKNGITVTSNKMKKELSTNFGNGTLVVILINNTLYISQVGIDGKLEVYLDYGTSDIKVYDASKMESFSLNIDKPAEPQQVVVKAPLPSITPTPTVAPKPTTVPTVVPTETPTVVPKPTTIPKITITPTVEPTKEITPTVLPTTVPVEKETQVTTETIIPSGITDNKDDNTISYSNETKEELKSSLDSMINSNNIDTDEFSNKLDTFIARVKEDRVQVKQMSLISVSNEEVSKKKETIDKLKSELDELEGEYDRRSKEIQDLLKLLDEVDDEKEQEDILKSAYALTLELENLSGVIDEKRVAYNSAVDDLAKYTMELEAKLDEAGIDTKELLGGRLSQGKIEITTVLMVAVPILIILGAILFYLTKKLKNKKKEY